ncbi:hypothetical protein K2Q00_01445 [Patescibacteria group bacterium]|nr:hypothetical protein [Patescibacteria group bacterium]
MVYANWDNIVLPKQRKELIAATVAEIYSLQKLVKRLGVMEQVTVLVKGGRFHMYIFTDGTLHTKTYCSGRDSYTRGDDYYECLDKDKEKLEKVIEEHQLTPQAVGRLAADLKRRAALKVWRPPTRKRRPK